MRALHGEIQLDQVIQETQREQHGRHEWRRAMARDDARRQESAILREWWRTEEKDRPEVVQHHRAVFDQIKANRKQANQIELAERAILDAAMRAKGYLIRPGRVWPRYVRPSWTGGDAQ